VVAVAEALRVVLDNTPALPAEEVALEDALGRVLAEDVRADLEMPPFDRSMMDGYAVRAADVARAPVQLQLAGSIRAGQTAERALQAGQALQLMTGAPLPEGADAVQQVEKTRRLGDAVEILAAVEPGQNVVARASEVAKGEQVLERGGLIDPAAIGVLATFGKARVRVGRRPALALLATGDELVDPELRPRGAQIRNSNGYAVAAQAKCAGARVAWLGVVADEQRRIVAAITPGLSGDALVVSGGVSAGAFDLVEAAFAELGVEVLFTRVEIKPGAPLVFGRRGALLVFGLPGNPVSAQVTFDVFVRAALLRMQGARVVSRRRVEVELLAPLSNRSRREAYLPVRVKSRDGRLVAEPLRSMGSADVAAHAHANALAILDAARERVQAGERAQALLLANFLEDGDAA
jgi:molybdenum cofactor synthesis domain-containing protein